MSKNFTYKRFLYLFILLFSLLSGRVQASHCVGVDLYYDYISSGPGGDTYRIWLAFYMDCAGATATPGGCSYTMLDCIPANWGYSCNAPGPVNYQLRSANANFCVQGTFSGTATVTDITPLCVTKKSDCSGGATKGVEQWLYFQDIVIPSKQTEWILTYSTYARNAGITTIRTPGSVGLNVECAINNTLINSSPRFSNLPVPFICVNNQFCFNNGATEPDGTDSLAYAMVKPMIDIAGNTVTYVGTPAFSATQPVRSTPPVSLDPITGDVCMTPTQQDITVFALKVTEYRKIAGVWKVIGSVIRDIQVRVISGCSNKPPTIAGTSPGTGGATNIAPYTYNFCANQNGCFTLPGSDPDAPDLLNIFYSVLPGSSLTVSGNNTSSPVGTFCWTPSLANVRSLPYTFTAIIKDNGCTYNAVQSFAFKINVKNCAAVPIGLTSFGAESKKELVQLIWKAVTDNNTKEFILERSHEGNTFTKLYSTRAIKEIEPKEYSFIDLQPFADKNYYRIGQVFSDGKIKYSEVQEAHPFTRLSAISIFPNPVINTMNIQFQSAMEGKISASIFDLNGKKILESEYTVITGENNLDLNLDKVERGIYLLKITDTQNSDFIQKRFIKEL